MALMRLLESVGFVRSGVDVDKVIIPVYHSMGSYVSAGDYNPLSPIGAVYQGWWKLVQEEIQLIIWAG